MKRFLGFLFVLIFFIDYMAVGDTPSKPLPPQAGHSGEFLQTNGTNALWNSVSGSGTVTSVDASVPAYMTISGNPVTTTGTLAFDFGSQTQNKFFASPNGSTGPPGFRAIVAADVPTLNQNTSGNAATATALAANPTDCATDQYANAIDASGNLSCAQVSYAQITGAPSLFYQTVQANTVDKTQRSKLNFSANFALSDSSSPSRSTVDLAATITANVIGNLTGNADTSTALATNPTDCGANTFATTIDASGNLTCSAVGDAALSVSYLKADGSRGLSADWNAGAHNITATTFIGALTGNSSTASALSANPADCSANQYATTIAANGDLTCAQVAYSQITSTPTLHYQTVQANTSAQTQRTNLNFSSNFAASDSLPNDRTTIDLAATVTATTFTGALSGNATTASALAADPSDCSTHQFANAIVASGNLTCAQPAFTDISGTASASQLPNPSASTLGGIESYAAVSNQWINAISTSGVPSSTQPAFSNLSGNIATSQMNSGTSASSTTFFRGDGTWATPSGTAPVAPSITTLLSTGTQTGWLITISAATVAAGDTYTNNGNTYTVLYPISGTSGQILFVSGAGATSGTTLTRATGAGSATITFSTKFATATYTTPTSPSPLYLRVKILAGGAGGAGGGTTGAGLGTGGNFSSFGTCQVAPGAASGAVTRGGAGGDNFSSTTSCFTLIAAINGGSGGGGGSTNGSFSVGIPGSMGGSSVFGGGGSSGAINTSNVTAAGGAAATNSGGGGGGGAINANVGNANAGGGGGAGAYIEGIITSPAASYPYIIGASAAAGGAGTSGGAGGTGAAGRATIEANFQ